MGANEKSLLCGILALELQFVTAAQLSSVARRWREDPKQDLAELLLKRKVLTPTRLQLVRSLAGELAKSRGGVKRSLAGARIPEALRETLALPKSPPPDGARYRLGRELGRGGLGRVVEAEDAAIGRTVALKMLLEGAPLEVVQRFRREGQLTGRLEHPNIVPVHEVGVLPGGDGGPAEVFFAMKRITGRDMGDVIDAMRHGSGGDWTQRRLVEAFRDVCRAVAFAHSKGVIHRDLKPSNVMLGEFGEVLVVDWGLAKEVRAARDPAPATVRKRAEVGLTLDGDVMGTPEYMAPEQAAGRTDEVDERSDVYSLGAILYEILAWRPPHRGRTASDVLRKVMSEAARAPSAAAGDVAAPSARRARPGDVRLPPIPPDLEAICVKALAREPAHRFGDAATLAREVDAWLEGSRERERRAAHAAGQVRIAVESLERSRALEASARAALERAETLKGGVAYHEGPERKKPIWDLEDEAARARREAVEAQTGAMAALSGALSVAPDHPEARRLMAGEYWERFLEAERKRDDAGQIHYRKLAETFNDGSLDAKLRGDGSLAVTTSRFGCACLRECRPVDPAELVVAGFHPWSGRCVQDPGSEDRVAGAEPDAPLRLRVHGRRCRREPAAGARAWVWRFEEKARRFVPVSPVSTGPAVPREVLDALFPDSECRPTGPGMFLGTTPVARRDWPMGSYLLIVEAKGSRPRRVPFTVGRQAEIALDVTIFGEDEIPPDCVPVHKGPFSSGADPGNPLTRRGGVHDLGDFFMARTPLTCATYLEWINALHRQDPAVAALHVPREARPCWPLEERGYVLPTQAWRKAASARGLEGPPLPDWMHNDWEAEWPVVAVSWIDALTYARALSLRTGFVFSVPTGLRQEKAARGTDGRFFPWGNAFDPSFCNMNASRPGPACPAPVGSFRSDESPYGVRDLAGNVHTFCLGFAPSSGQRHRGSRGGAWIRTELFCRASQGIASLATAPLMATGIRLAAEVQLPVAERSEDE